MDIVQEQNALADCLKPTHRELNDLIGFDMAMPVVGVRIGREDDQATRGELAFEESERARPGMRDGVRLVGIVLQQRASRWCWCDQPTRLPSEPR